MRALVLSGGGSKGAYQVGVLYRLLAQERQPYDLFAGVSVGAINAAHLAQFPVGKEDVAFKKLRDLWLSITTSSVRKRWCPFGRLHALWQPAIYNSRPLRNFLAANLNRDAVIKSGKMLRLGAVSLDTGVYRVFDETTESLLDAVLASASFPASLLPVEIEGDLWTDGGVRNVTPLRCAIDAGATDIDVIMTSPKDPTYSRLESAPNAFDVAMRSIDIMGAEVIAGDLEQALLINRLVQLGEADTGKRYIRMRVFRPSHNLGVAALDFEPAKIRMMIERGEDDAAAYDEE